MKASEVDWRTLTKDEDQEAMVEGVEVSVRRRMLAARRWEMEGRAQNLKSVALDWGSWRHLERQETEEAKLSALGRKEAAKVAKPIG
jgi:hypothetical protein